MAKVIRFGFQIPLFWCAVLMMVFAFSPLSRADSLDHWHWRNPLPQGDRLLNVVSANGTFIALGETGTILTSIDGTNWLRRESGTSFALHDCAYGSGQYVVIGEDGTVLTSSDLVSWAPHYAGTFYALNGITYTNSQFVAVGDGTTILTSADGASWTQRSSGPWPLFDVTYAAGTYVAVGGTFVSSSTPGVGVVLTSQDGAVWSVRNVSGGPFFSVAYGQGMFATVGGFDGNSGTSFIWTSNDATNWVPGNNSPFLLTKVAYAQGKWMVGQGNLYNGGPFYIVAAAIYASDNLENVSLVVSNSSGIEGFAFANGKFVAARENGTFLTSPDGLTWTNPAPEPLSLYFHDLKYLNGSFVGVGDNTLSFSSDGTTWTNAPQTNNLLSITYGNGRYIAGGEYRTVWTSTDALNWTNAAPDLEIFPYLADVHVAFGNGTFVGASGYYADILTSPDGVNWSVQQLTNGFNYTYFQDVTFGKGVFVAVSTPLIATSSDGTNWLGIDTDNSLTGVASGNGKLVAVGFNVIMTSADGTNWTTQSSSKFGLLSKVAFGGGFFVAVANQPSSLTTLPESAIWVSSDGLHWSKRNSRTSRGLTTVAFGNGTFVIAGDNSLILQSDPIINLSLTISGMPQLLLNGPTNRSYRIECSDALSPNASWATLTNLTLSASPSSFIDINWTNHSTRFYRAALLQ